MISHIDRQLVAQAVIVSTMMLTVARAMHGDYRRKHVGAVWEELLTAFVLWHSDTIKSPMTVLGISKYLGIPRSNVARALVALIEGGVACKVGQRYGRDVTFISVRPNSKHFRDIREAIMLAGRELEKLFRGT